MGTRADFYIGRGEKAAWLGSTAMDGNIDSQPDEILLAKTQDDFVRAVTGAIEERDDGTQPSQGWPWPWKTSNTTDYSYAFDDGTVYVCCFGYKWATYVEWQANVKAINEWCEKERALTSEGLDEEAIEAKIGTMPASVIDADGKECVFPDMTDVQNVDFGRRSGILIIGG
jgi:hypothetical protein